MPQKGATLESIEQNTHMSNYGKQVALETMYGRSTGRYEVLAEGTSFGDGWRFASPRAAKMFAKYKTADGVHVATAYDRKTSTEL